MQLDKPTLLKLYKTHTCKEIAEKFGFKSDETIRKKLKIFGIERRKGGQVPIKKPTLSQIKNVYPRLTIKEAGAVLGVGQTLMLEWLNELGLERIKSPRLARNQEHSKKIADALKGRTYPEKRKGKSKPCAFCGKEIYLPPNRLKNSEDNYCSISCRGQAKRVSETTKICPNCEKTFLRRLGETTGNWTKRKFCSKKCSLESAPPPTLFGANNPRFKGEEARRRQPRGQQKSWRKRVLERDSNTCKRCGVSNVPLVAHHIKSWEHFKALRNDINNGITLCYPCHFKEHGWELSTPGIKRLVDERGIEQRKWTGFCLWCDTLVIKPVSDLRRSDGSYRTYAFCNKKCAMQASGKIRKGMAKENFKGLNISKEFEKQQYAKKRK